MNKPTVVFIAGERQHAGKTVTSLGLISALCNHINPADIGYFKPVGQELVTLPSGERIDKDVRIVQEFTDLDMPDLGILSPVRVVSGLTREYIASNNPRERTAAFEKAIHKSMEHLAGKRLIIAEGTGHPGVGSVIGLSNARVANMLAARILYLVGGGIGRTLDELEVDLSYFSHKQCRVAGVLFNKVRPTKLDMMCESLPETVLERIFPEWDPSLKIFGYMPQVKYLNNPSMQLVSRSFKTPRIVEGSPESAWHRACRKVVVVSQGSDAFLPENHLKSRDIAVIGAGSHTRLKRIIDFNTSLPDNEKLGGIILTCASARMPDDVCREWLGQSGIPALVVSKDTANTDMTLHKCFSNTKLQLYDKKKHRRIVSLFAKHFDAERFIHAYGL